MQTLTRAQFIAEMNRIIANDRSDCSDPTHFIWHAEKFNKDRFIHCNWFVRTKPINIKSEGNNQYWTWVKETLKGDIACFSSDKSAEQEWWGFTNEEDITMWFLRWVK